MKKTVQSILLLLIALYASGLPIFAQQAGVGRWSALDTSTAEYGVGGGTAQAQTVTLSPFFISVTAGLRVCWLPAANNTAAAPTLAVNGQAAKAITKFGTTAVAANDITTTAIACARYDGTQFQLQNPQTAGSAGTVTNVSWTGGIVTVANGGTTPSFTIAGNSGGIPYFSSASTWASSSALTAHGVVLGEGAGSAPVSTAAGTNGQLLIGQTGADPTWNTLSGDCTVTSGGVLTCTQLNGANFTFNTSGLITKLDGITTAGTGVPIIGWVSNVTGQSASQATVTLASAPGAGDYRVNFYVNQNALCTTGTNSVFFTFNWTDGGNARSETTGVMVLNTAQSTTAGYLSGLLPIHVASGNVTYTSTVTGTCTTGTSTYDIHAELERVQ